MERQGKYLPREPDDNMIEAAYPLISEMPHDTPNRAKRLIRAIYSTMWDMSPEPKPTDGLTRNQRKVQQFLADYIDTKRHAPTYAEISMAIWQSDNRGRAYRVIKSLQRKGIVQMPVFSGKRTIRLITRPGEAPKVPKIYAKRRTKK